MSVYAKTQYHVNSVDAPTIIACFLANTVRLAKVTFGAEKISAIIETIIC